MTTGFCHSASAAGTLAVLLATVLSTLVSQLSGVVSAQCVECQLLLSQHSAPRSHGIVINHHPFSNFYVACPPCTSRSCLQNDACYLSFSVLCSPICLRNAQTRFCIIIIYLEYNANYLVLTHSHVYTWHLRQFLSFSAHVDLF